MSGLPVECPGGYWMQGNGQGDASICEPVGMGFYSPPLDTARYPCTPGTFSNTDTALNCQKCASGSYSSQAQASECTPCNRGSYAIELASQECLPCNDLYYTGIASDYAIYLSAQKTGQEQGDLYCLEPIQGHVYAAVSPTNVPTVSPRPSGSPTLADLVNSSSATIQPIVGAAPTTLEPSGEQSTWNPTPPLIRPDSTLDNKPFLGRSRDTSTNPAYVSNAWVSIVLAAIVATVMGLVVLWHKFEPPQEDEFQDGTSVSNKESPQTSRRGRSTSNDSDSILSAVDNDMFDDFFHPQNLESGSCVGMSGAASIWSMSVGLRHDPDNEQSSNSSVGSNNDLPMS